MTGLFSYPKRKLRKLISQGEYEKAIEFGNELEVKFSKDPDFLFIMGSMFYILNDEKKTLGLLLAIDNKLVLPGEIGAAFRQLLKQHPNETVREQAAAHFGRQNTQRDQLVAERLAGVNPMKGDAASGELLFTTHCATCHKLGNTGNAAGPDLAAIADKTPRALLTAILNPNQAVEDRFSVYALATNNDTQLAGMIASEGANSVTLMDLNGQQRQILRTDIQSLTSLGRSLMPEGFEQVLSNQNLADLIAIPYYYLAPQSYV